jgi:hypothetical protein
MFEQAIASYNAAIANDASGQGIADMMVDETAFQLNIEMRRQVIEMNHTLVAENESLAAENESLAADKERLTADNERIAALNYRFHMDNTRLGAEVEAALASRERAHNALAQVLRQVSVLDHVSFDESIWW